MNATRAGWTPRWVLCPLPEIRPADALSAGAAGSWPLARIDVTLRAILRAGAYELGNRADVPARVVIAEYVDVAKAFFEDDVPGMVNGVLDALARQLRAAEFSSATERS